MPDLPEKVIRPRRRVPNRRDEANPCLNRLLDWTPGYLLKAGAPCRGVQYRGRLENETESAHLQFGIAQPHELELRSEDPRHDICLSIPAIFRSKISQVFFYQKLCFLFRNKPSCPCRCDSFSPDSLLDLFPVHLLLQLKNP